MKRHCLLLSLLLLAAPVSAQQLPKTTICSPSGMSQNCMAINSDGSTTVTDVPWQPSPMPGTAQYGLAVSGVTTLTVPAAAKCASILSETANVRYTTSGTTPSASVGMGPIVPGTPLQFCGSATLAALKFFAVSGSPTLDVEYFQ